MSRVVAKAEGYLAVSREGVTASGSALSQDILCERVATVSVTLTDLTVAVGFGISNAVQWTLRWPLGDAVVVGSALSGGSENRAGVLSRLPPSGSMNWSRRCRGV